MENVEKAQATDVASLVELRLAYLREDNGFLSESDADAVSRDLPDYFRAHLEKDLLCYVIREGGEIVSCAFLLLVEKPMSPAFLNGKTGTVLNVYTRPAFRGRGYAGRIMERLLAEAREMDLSTVELKSTEAGHALYLAAGFRDVDSHYRLMKWTNRQRESRPPETLGAGDREAR